MNIMLHSVCGQSYQRKNVKITGALQGTRKFQTKWMKAVMKLPKKNNTCRFCKTTGIFSRDEKTVGISQEDAITVSKI